ncbi:uncharacterized protein LOC131254264 [Magnolia sinica]|uniref:uncharacterized protein LOC131254264 n=1 Tax=Magnolia sinica TaxID=86752 RepID=UPI002658C40A|nr:uncharacterized protein LOC131254264 [Magnolia sinica]
MNVVSPAPPVHPARKLNANSLFELFQRFRPPTFTGTHKPKEVEYWLDHISKMLKPLHYTKAEQVELVTYMFEKEASLWWDSILRTVPEDYVWTWDPFKTHFHGKYLPLTYHNEKESDFLRLRQGGMTVVEYENRFMELAKYAPLILVDEPM